MQKIQIINMGFLKVKAVKLFFTPEDTDDPVNNAKRYFLQTGMSS